jgi:hypothetical protein
MESEQRLLGMKWLGVLRTEQDLKTHSWPGIKVLLLTINSCADSLNAVMLIILHIADCALSEIYLIHVTIWVLALLPSSCDLLSFDER